MPYLKKFENSCQYCNKSFVTNKPHQQFCTVSCSVQYRRPKQKMIDMRKCCFCGNDYEKTKQTGAKYCSSDCASLAKKLSDAMREKNTRMSIFNRDNHKCVYCNRSPIEHDVVLQVDHIIPLAKGGSSTVDNLVTSCSECNVSKLANAIADDKLNAIQTMVASRNLSMEASVTARIKALFTKDANKRVARARLNYTTNSFADIVAKQMPL